MRITIVGPGRAGGALAAAAHQAGHDIAAVVGRASTDFSVADELSVPTVFLGDRLPAADLAIIAVRDDAIAGVAEQLAPTAGEVAAAVHVSGLTSTAALAPLADAGLETGSFHPLQSLPDWRTGADALAGSFIALTAGEDLTPALTELATSLGASPFHIDDDAKALYHAAAAASANYVIAALAVGESLFTAAGVDGAVARPLVEAVVANAFDLGPSRALTGPIARGDISTVEAQLAAIAQADPDLLEHFKAMGRATASLAHAGSDMEDLLA